MCPPRGSRRVVRRCVRSICRGCCLRRPRRSGSGWCSDRRGRLIALGLGLGTLAMRLVKRDAPEQAVGLMAAAGSFAAVVVDLRLTGDRRRADDRGDRARRPILPLVLLPGLLAAGVGSLVFIGLGSFSGLSTAAWSLSPFPLPPFGGPAGATSAGRSCWPSPPPSPCSRSWSSHAGRSGSSISTRSADDRRWARRRRSRDRVRRSDRQLARRRALLRPGGVRLALRTGGDHLALDADAAAPVQRARLDDLARELPRRPDLPRDLPRRRRRAHGPAPARLRRDPGGGRLIVAACVSSSGSRSPP